MSEPYDPTRPTLERLLDECRRSAEDVAAGRVAPLEPFLRDLRERALARIKARETEGRAEDRAENDAA